MYENMEKICLNYQFDSYFMLLDLIEQFVIDGIPLKLLPKVLKKAFEEYEKLVVN